MGLIEQEAFVCFDCETTGLDPEKDQIIEIAAVKFNFREILGSMEHLIDPKCPIPPSTTKIHHITNDMVKGQPSIGEVLPKYLQFFHGHLLIGHTIYFDITIVEKAARQAQIPSTLLNQPYIDTLRMARLYGGSSINSLEMLRSHFNIKPTEAHRAMNDVKVNIKVFKYLSKGFKTTEELIKRLKRPIQLKLMPLGKYKGRSFNEIPLQYLKWAAKQNFDQDLLFSIRHEINKRKGGESFGQVSNPFSQL